ncbi:MAG TPA: Crp/Fnr family transcriptional regulator [Gammaproteobacteria bacterium]|nr:Crp/Fnr family transcriptional regulator [Gammaproteobacteria bacterium]
MAQARSNADASTAVARVDSSSRPKCTSCLFKPQCLPAGLDGEALLAFERALSRQAHPVRAGQAVVRQGDAVRALYALRVGVLKATILTDDGGERVAGFRSPGTVIGLAEPQGGHWTRTFVALRDSWLCHIPLESLNEAVERQLVKLMAERLRREYDCQLALAFKDRAGKLADFLLDISESQRRQRLSPHHFTLAMPYADIASYLGMRGESVCRALADLRRRGLIEYRGRRFAIPSLEALRAI